MGYRLGSSLLALTIVFGPTTLFPAGASDTGHAAPQPGLVVSADPASFTPHVMDGAVYTITKVGNTVVVGGSFTRVRNEGSNTDITRRNVFAFNATTGQVIPTFAPNPNNAVNDVLPAADGLSVYIGGAFTSIASGPANRLYRADISTGNRVASYTGTSFGGGQVRDLSLTGNRLYVAGGFTTIGGVAQRALAAVDATTGVRDTTFSPTFTGSHQPNTSTWVKKIATNPANTMLVAVGNFGFVNGQTRHQFAVFDIAGGSASLANYYTTLFQSACSSNFDTYMTDVQFSPGGSFFAISTTGAFGGATASLAGTTGCDVVARFETNAAGLNVRPTWTAYPGGDTTHSVEVTLDVVYVGGHQRWQNNPTRGDAAGQGAVARPGIAALSALNGLPLTWNPTRARGVGVKDMIATAEGLFVGSDTDVIGGETHRKVAFFPLQGGTALPVLSELTLPGEIFRVESGQAQLLQRGFDGSQVTVRPNPPNGSGWGTTVGAFMINGILYTAYSNGDFTRRTFDGQAYGAAEPVDTADAIVRQTDWHNTEMPGITSLFYSQGKMYFTRLNDSNLYNRAFHPESDVVGQQRFSTPSVNGVSFSSMRGAFVAGNKLYFAANGNLNVADWNGSGPVANTEQVLASAGGGWSSRVMFLYQAD